MSFTFFGIPVTIRLSFFILSGLLAYPRAAKPWLMVEWIAVVALAVFVHELGHALAYRRYGHVPAIELHGMGGLTYSRGGRDLSLREDAVVSFAGPFFGFLLAGVVFGAAKAYGGAGDDPFVAILVTDLLWVSAGWSIMNLLPMLPLDGGNLMFTAMKAISPTRAVVRAHVISLVVALAAAVAARLAGWTFSIYLALWFAWSNARALLEMRHPTAPAASPGVMAEAAGNAPEAIRAEAEWAAAVEHAAAGRLESAYAAVDRAIHGGFRDLARFDADPGLAPLRDQVRWPSLRASLVHRTKSASHGAL